MSLSPVDVFWYELVLAGGSVLTSIALAIYIGRKGTKTVSNYLHGNKRMPLWAVTLSHLACGLSALTVVGVPTETYFYGSISLWNVPVQIAAGATQSYVFLPVLYKFQFVSLFEYCEHRFTRSVRNIVSAINAVFELAISAITAHAVSLVINQFTGIDTTISMSVIIAICTVYTSIGGFRGVVYTDCFQFVIMIVSFIVVFVLSFIKAGGIQRIASSSAEGGRWKFFDFRWSERQSTWSVIIGYYFAVSLSWIGPAAYQRAVSLPELEKAQKASMYFSYGCATITLAQSLVGMMLYTVYKYCDPVSAKIVDRFDKVLPYFVLMSGAAVPGLIGLFIASLLCASLSTIATYLNNSAGVAYKDFIQRFLNERQSEESARRAIKLVCVGLGAICWLIALSLKKMSSIFDMFFGFAGLASGAVFAVFFIGLFIPRIRQKALLWAVYPWIGIMVYRSVTQVARPTYPTLTMSVENCPFNVTSIRNTSLPINPKVWNDLNFIHKIPNSLNSLIAFIFIVAVSYGASFITCETSERNVDPELLSPLIRQSSAQRGPNEDRSVVPLLVLQSSNINR